MTLLTGTYGARRADDLLEVLRSPAALACDLIELRLDLPQDATARVEELVAAAPRPVLATCRAHPGIDAAARAERLLRAASAGAAWVDVEEDSDPAVVADIARTGARILRSSHVPALPADAGSLVARLLAPPATAAKFVALRGTAADAARLLSLVRAHRGRLAAHVVSVPFTRPASAALGAPLVYAALRPGTGLGLRLPSVRWMTERARVRRLAAGSGVFLLLGRDVGGSVSPDMLNAAFEATGPDLVSLRWSCEEVEPALRAILDFGWAGAAVTTPHKETALKLVRDGLGTIAPTAERVGALNTVLREGNSLVAHNTDLGGLLDVLSPHADGAAGRASLVLGGGGAARAAAAALQDLGTSPVVLARTPERARGWGAVVTEEEAAQLSPFFVVDATPAGPPGGRAVVDVAALAPAVVLDMLVTARPTALLADAAAHGHRPVEGLAMLVAQAARQAVLLGGAPPDRAAMTRAGRAALVQRDRPILLTGLRCAGKSRLAPLVAELLGRRAVDTDALLEERLQRRADEMIRAGEEPAFRAAEEDVLRACANLTGVVLALGGGASLHGETFTSLAAASFVVHLVARDDVLLARWAAAPRAPLSSLPPAAELARQQAQRETVYASHAHFTLDTSESSPELAAERIADRYEEEGAREPAPRSESRSGAPFDP